MRTMLVGLGVAAALAVPVATADASGRPFLGGLTAQREPVVVKLSRDGREIARTSAALDLKCSDGARVTFTDDYERVPVSGSGRFHEAYDTGDVTNADGSHSRLRGSLHGRVTHAGTAISGTWTMTLTGSDDQGTYTCRSGPVRFSAGA
jgi:hypothetical protein